MSYEYFTEVASSYREAEDLISQKYGERATILQRRQKMVGGFLGLFRKDAVEVSGYVSLEPVRRNAAARVQPNMASRRSNYSNDSQIMANQYRSNAQIPASAAGQARQAASNGTADLESAKAQILKAAGMSDPSSYTRILAEIKGLREEVQRNNSGTGEKSSEPEAFTAVRELLQENEFSAKFIEEILCNCRNLPLAELEDQELVQQKVLEWIGECIRIHEDLPRSRPRVMVLVGPTGVGKTTTIAKLAAQYHLGKIDGKRNSVRIITIDNYRIGAKKQIETYGDIMNIPVESAESAEELKKWLDTYHDVDMIFVDTIGKSPNEFETLGRMNSLLQVCGPQAEVHLAFSATTRSTDIKRIMQQFEPFNYRSVVVTKTDETGSMGTVISSLWEKNKEVSFVTNGQSVPHDLRPADKSQFLRRLSGFKIDQDRLSEQYEKSKAE